MKVRLPANVASCLSYSRDYTNSLRTLVCLTKFYLQTSQSHMPQTPTSHPTRCRRSHCLHLSPLKWPMRLRQTAPPGPTPCLPPSVHQRLVNQDHTSPASLAILLLLKSLSSSPRAMLRPMFPLLVLLVFPKAAVELQALQRRILRFWKHYGAKTDYGF